MAECSKRSFGNSPCPREAPGNNMPPNPTPPRAGPADRGVFGSSAGRGRPDAGFAWPLVWVRFAALSIRELDRPVGLRALWADQRVRDAVRLASPSLARGVDRHVATGAAEDPRLYRSLRAYHSRMAGRATPFGLLAGVFTARLSADAAGAPRDLGMEYHLRSETTPTREGPLGGHEVIQSNPGLQGVAGGYLVPPRGALRCPPDQATHVSGSPTMRRIIARLRTPLTVDAAIEWLCGESGSSAAEWLSCLERLEQRDILVRVRPVGASPRVRHSVVAPGAESTLTALDDEALSRHGTAPTRASVDAFGRAADGSAIPALIGDHAVLMCDTLDRVNPPARYPAHLRAMAVAFRRRFGPGAQVPLPDVFSLTRGIRGGLVEADEPVRERSSDRDRVLRQLLDTAGADPLVRTLDPDAVDALATPATPVHLPPRAPVQELLLRSFHGPAGLRSELAFAGPAAAFGGRFAHLLPPDSRAELGAQVGACDRLFAPFEVAELVLAPVSRGRWHVGVVPLAALRDRRVSVGPGVDASGPDSTGAEDILVGVEGSPGRFCLWSRVSGRPLHIVQSSMVRDQYLAPLEAFLLQVSRAQFRYSRPFDWGGLSELDFLPGIQVGPVLVSSPRWLLRGEVLGSGTASVAGLRGWMRRWDVPDRFVVRPVGSDRGVLVRRGSDDDLLLRMLRRSTSGRLELASGPDALGQPFLTDATGAPHVAEVAVTVATPPPRCGVDATHRKVLVTAALVTELNSAWSAFEVTMPWAAVAPFLTTHLNTWLAGLTGLTGLTGGAADRVWWEVERHPEPLLRVCVPVADAEGQAVADSFWRWSGRLRQQGELLGVTQAEHHFHASLSATPQGRPRVWEFLAADARHTLAVLTADPVTSRRFVVQTTAQVYRLAERSGVDRARLRESLRSVEGRAGGRLYRRIGEELDALARRHAGTTATPMLRRWQRALDAYVSREPALTGDDVVSLARLSLDRLCVTDVLRPYIFGAARRLLDRGRHEERTRP